MPAVRRVLQAKADKADFRREARVQRRAMRVSRALRFGCVWINDHFSITPEMPHGGYKESGYGKDMSMYALEDYTEVKHVVASLD